MLRAVLLVSLLFFISINSQAKKTLHNLPYGVILQYHHVSDSTPKITSVTPKQLMAHLDLMDELGIKVISLPDLIDYVNQDSIKQHKVAAITFDDGYNSIYEQAYPILKARNLPFTVFVNPKAMDDKHGGQMTWQQLREMEQHGATFANHTQHHNHLLNRLQDESQAEWLQRTQLDIEQAQARLEKELKHPEKWLAYPYGEFDHHIKKLVKDMGFLGFSQQSGGINITTDWQAIPRFPASGYYANVNTLKTKLLSKPFEIISQLPQAQLRYTKDTAPELMLTVKKDDIGTHAIQCFYSGKAVETKKEINGNTVTIKTRFDGSLPVGRSRYNCTAPSSERGQYYWYSMPFITTNEQQVWVD